MDCKELLRVAKMVSLNYYNVLKNTLINGDISENEKEIILENLILKGLKYLSNNDLALILSLASAQVVSFIYEKYINRKLEFLQQVLKYDRLDVIEYCLDDENELTQLLKSEWSRNTACIIGTSGNRGSRKILDFISQKSNRDLINLRIDYQDLFKGIIEGENFSDDEVKKYYNNFGVNLMISVSFHNFNFPSLSLFLFFLEQVEQKDRKIWLTNSAHFQENADIVSLLLEKGLRYADDFFCEGRMTTLLKPRNIDLLIFLIKKIGTRKLKRLFPITKSINESSLKELEDDQLLRLIFRGVPIFDHLGNTVDCYKRSNSLNKYAAILRGELMRHIPNKDLVSIILGGQ
jgi:hypothetical protein